LLERRYRIPLWSVIVRNFGWLSKPSLVYNAKGDVCRPPSSRNFIL
jgi:hypothetical protein